MPGKVMGCGGGQIWITHVDVHVESDSGRGELGRHA